MYSLFQFLFYMGFAMVMVFLIIAAIIAVIALWAVSGYNNLVQNKSLVQEAWSGIDVQLKRRYDLIPNLVETVKSYSIHESNIIENIVRMRAASMGASQVADKETAEVGLAGSLKTLFAISEQYPDLKANQNFLSLQKELSSVEQELQLARRYYNGTVRNYNILTKQFPTNLIASYAGFGSISYFEITDHDERSAPKMKF